MPDSHSSPSSSTSSPTSSSTSSPTSSTTSSPTSSSTSSPTSSTTSSPTSSSTSSPTSSPPCSPKHSAPASLKASLPTSAPTSRHQVSRCNDKAYFVLLGLTGAGKSSTLNMLFDGARFREMDSYTSATSSILEYSVNVPKFGSSGAEELIVIDTPGFGDTRDEEFQRDARFLATLEDYILHHPQLQSVYPNVILLAIKYTDTNITGETSPFIQMLQGLQSLVSKGILVDVNPKTCNLVVVLTHTMQEEDKIKQGDPIEKVKLIDTLIKQFTTISTPIYAVMAENKPQDYKLEEVNGYFALPNGDHYPYNLFTVIQNKAEQAGDRVCERIVRGAFRQPKELTKNLVDEIALMPPQNQLVKKYMEQLRNAKFNTKETGMSSLLDKLWDEIHPEIRQKYENSLSIAKKVFQDHGIYAENEIPKNAQDIHHLVADLVINPCIRDVLTKLEIRPPRLPNETLGVGWFYNVSTDSIGNDTPFDWNCYEISNFGFYNPSDITGSNLTETFTRMEPYFGKPDYLEKRLQELGVAAEISLNQITSEPIPGCTITTGGTAYRISGVREFRKLSISLSPQSKHFLKPNYIHTMRHLPKLKTLRQHKAAVPSWTSFFRETGTHYVKSCYGGGSIEILAERNKAKRFSTLDKTVGILMNRMLVSLGTVCKFDLENEAPDWDFFVKFYGGVVNESEIRLFRNVTNLYSEKGKDIIATWEKSLFLHPVMLKSDIRLESVIYQIQLVELDLSDRVEVAMSKLFNYEARKGKTSLSKSRRDIKPRRIRTKDCKIT